MRWTDRLASRWKYPEQRVWVAVLALALVLSALAVATAANYASVLVARTGVSLVPQERVGFVGTNASGVLLAGGTVTLNITLTVTNPSTQRLAFETVTYRSWIEDFPEEAGLANRSGVDAILSDSNGVHRFFTVFSGTIDVAAPAISGGGASTVSRSVNLTRADDPGTFAVVQNITEYTAATRGSGTAAPWTHWLLIVLRLIDLPFPSATASQDLTNLARIIIEEGQNLG